jgi:hypothetical protein
MVRRMGPELYDRVHRIRQNCVTREYPNISKEDIGRIYSETRLSVERNTCMRDIRTIDVTTAIAISKLEERLLPQN